MALPLTLSACSGDVGSDFPTSMPDTEITHSPLGKSAVPSVTDDSPHGKAVRAVDAMTLDERIGQLVMAPLPAGSDPSTLRDLIVDQHVGSVLIIGNWNSGTTGVSAATSELQSYAPSNNRLLMTTDQEGGSVQHLSGNGFDTMPSATDQGTMDTAQLRQSAATWGAQLKSAGINVDLAPVVGTVTVDRSSNAPIGALNRDFGLDAAGNAKHAKAFIEGMSDSGVGSAVKHYPGLGSVTGNTDFTASGILDTTTTLDGPEISAFNSTLEASPSMVMMSLATYQAIDPDNPAVFSSTLVTGYLRGKIGFQGVVTSDSLSATALSGVQPSDLGVRLVEAGGDLACIGASSYVQPVLDGLNAKAAGDATFARKVQQSAIRVMTLKYEMGLAR
ncbi:glycoside hydrolase family 3 N-terminal domain-containing protein [Bifidobacterium ruminantium]|uniref:glycoside hydrolase family 3 N-terminal domain-containing protein n=2 Tax=Bifidobacterium ruminantium TaxID=78346 RepID=UPI001C2333DF|nr:glycoside hydrolase family 3 N-terminal domain-containing protein [Bifidobacterium ruminantium]MBU9111821.1 beta-glucosidase [Bifidobacterium ruminantium]